MSSYQFKDYPMTQTFVNVNNIIIYFIQFYVTPDGKG